MKTHRRLRSLSCLAAALLLAAACSTPPKTGSVPPQAGGKYYLDDGPPEKVPDNLAAVPDAVPRDEPLHRFANRPYTVFGRSYVPVADKRPMKERGVASWYGRRFHGQRTASGEPYDMFAMTAAHKTLPIPSYVRVTNVKNGQSVVVRINDRGPFHGDRIIDLSYAAAQRLGMVSAGSALVEVERIVPGAAATEEAAAPPPQPAMTGAVTDPVPVAAEPTGLWLQLGAFSSLEGAESFREQVARQLPWMLEPIDVASRDGVHRVRLGPYRNPDEASAVGEKVRRSLGFAPVVVR